jgi:hypothetical protein
MSTTLYIKSDQHPQHILYLVKSTIDAEVVKLELALEMADKRLRPFEEKYQVTSDYFIAHLAAEDLEGTDDEYVCWAGEYHLKQKLLQKLQQLKEISYDDSGIFSAN